MPLIVGSKHFTSQSSVELVAQAIKALPEPEIINGYNNPLPSHEIGLCLQGEKFYFDLFNPLNQIKYIGSKTVVNCILVYIYSEIDHLCVHVDSSLHIGLVDDIVKFKDKSHIQVSLAGGVNGDNQSVKNLTNIINDLLAAAEKLNINISIKTQKILENNLPAENDKYEYCFDRILLWLPMVYKTAYNKKLDMEIFQGNHPGELQSNEMTDERLKCVVAAILNATPIRKSLEERRLRGGIYLDFKGKFPDEKAFYEIIKKVFCKQVFEFFDKNFTMHNTYPNQHLDTFAFLIGSEKIYRLSRATPTPFEATRRIAMLDRFKFHPYRHCYDHATQTYSAPQLSNTFTNSYQKLIDRMRSMPVYRDDLKELLALDNSINTADVVCKYILEKSESPSGSQLSLSTSNLSIFNIKKELNDIYLLDTLSTTHLEYLNGLTNKKFIAKRRYKPEYTIDAMLPGDIEELKNIQSVLNGNGIHAHVIQFSNESCHFLCVPAINVVVEGKSYYRFSN